MLPTRHHDPRLDQLGAVALFRGCPRKELAAIARVTYPVTMAAGTVLCRQGQRGDEAFVIIDGQAVATVDGTEVARLGPGSVCGEMALLDGGGRSATVTAVTPMNVFALSIRDFDQLLYVAPTAVRRMLVSLTGRLRLSQGGASLGTEVKQ